MIIIENFKFGAFFTVLLIQLEKFYKKIENHF